MIREIKRQAKLSLKGNWGKAILACFVLTVISGMITAIGNINSPLLNADFDTMTLERLEALIKASATSSNVLQSMMSFVEFLIAGALSFGLATFFIRWIRNDRPEIEHLFSGFNKEYFLKTFLIHVISTLYIALWTLLFIVPGIIKSFAYSQAYRIAYDHPEMSALDCIRESERIMYGHKMQLFELVLSFFGWYLLVAITFGIALLWLQPLMETSNAIFYDTIRYHPVFNEWTDSVD